MNVLFLSHYYWPHIGGVEKHAERVASSMQRMGNKVTVLTEKYEYNLRTEELKNKVKIIRFEYPQIKYLGLLYIWFWLWKNRHLIKQSDIVHCHDVFIWYLPFRFLYPKKPVYTTIHGLEWDDPLSFKSIWQKRLAVKLSTGAIGVGKFLEKYLKVKFDKMIYGAA
jgi:glycosyltransferase involved in cell wall biosynthesis